MKDRTDLKMLVAAILLGIAFLPLLGSAQFALTAVDQREALGPAQALAGRIRPGLLPARVERLMGRPPDRIGGDEGGGNVDAVNPFVHEWTIGRGRVLVRFENGRSTYASALPAPTGPFEVWRHGVKRLFSWMDG